MKKVPKVDNILVQKYVCSKPNHVVCIDMSFLSEAKGKNFFAGIDLATRCVVCHFYKEGPIQQDDILTALGVTAWRSSSSSHTSACSHLYDSAEIDGPDALVNRKGDKLCSLTAWL